jgi:cobalt/nickel transport system permease protein
MTSTPQLVAAPESVLRGFDSRWKLAALGLAAIATTLVQTLGPAAAALIGALALAVLGRLPPRWCLVRLGGAALVVAPFLLMLPLLHRDDGPALSLGPLAISMQGFIAAVLLGLKTLSLVLLILVLLATAPLPDTFQAAQRLHVPGALVQVALLTYRYVFVLAGELARIRLALRVRGYRNRVSLHSYRTAGHVAGTLLVRGYERAERVGQAMRCRGFDGQFRSLIEFRTRPIDVVLFSAIVGSAALVFASDFAQR